MCMSHSAWSANPNMMHLHLRINVLIHYMHAFLHPSVLFPSSHKASTSVPLFSSVELKPLPNTLKYAFLGLNETFPMIFANDLNVDQEI